jgi:uncharacterized membrane protein YccF (DUF307 family)
MESLKAVDALLGIVVIGLGWWNTTMWSEIKDLRIRDSESSKEMTRLQVLIAGNYITREELRDSMREMTMAVTNRIDQLGATVNTQLTVLHEDLKDKADKT